VVQSDSGVRRPQPRRRLRATEVRYGGGTGTVAAPLLVGSQARGVQTAGGGLSGGDRDGSPCRAGEPGLGAARGRRDPGAEASYAPEPDEEIARSAFHVVAKEVRETFWVAYSMFLAAFREAAEKLKTGNLSAVRFRWVRSRQGCPSYAPCRRKRDRHSDHSLKTAAFQSFDQGGNEEGPSR